MNPFVFYVSLLALVLLLTTCHKAEACPLLAETRPAVGLVPANGDGLPYYGPQGSLFPQPVPGAMELPPQAVTVPLPSGGGFMQFLQLIGTFVVAWLLRSQNRIMSPPE